VSSDHHDACERGRLPHATNRISRAIEPAAEESDKDCDAGRLEQQYEAQRSQHYR
jgi:hypothetical protein